MPALVQTTFLAVLFSTLFIKSRIKPGTLRGGQLYLVSLPMSACVPLLAVHSMDQIWYWEVEAAAAWCAANIPCYGLSVVCEMLRIAVHHFLLPLCHHVCWRRRDDAAGELWNKPGRLRLLLCSDFML